MNLPSDPEKRRQLLKILHIAMAKKGIVRKCPKCGSLEAPCAYPNNNYEKCPMKEERGYGT